MNLPEHLKLHLAQLRADPDFHEIMKRVTRTRIVPFPNNGDVEKASARFIFQSGRLAGENSIMIEVLGYDPIDRPTE